MSYDMTQSRRTYHELCYWWAVEPQDNVEKIVMEKQPNGMFSAKKTRVYTDQLTNNSGFMYDSMRISLKSPDNLFGIKPNYIVKFDNEYWLVVSCSYSDSRIGQSEFAKEKDRSHFWYLELRK